MSYKWLKVTYSCIIFIPRSFFKECRHSLFFPIYNNPTLCLSEDYLHSYLNSSFLYDSIPLTLIDGVSSFLSLIFLFFSKNWLSSLNKKNNDAMKTKEQYHFKINDLIKNKDIFRSILAFCTRRKTSKLMRISTMHKNVIAPKVLQFKSDLQTSFEA